MRLAHVAAKDRTPRHEQQPADEEQGADPHNGHHCRLPCRVDNATGTDRGRVRSPARLRPTAPRCHFAGVTPELTAKSAAGLPFQAILPPSVAVPASSPTVPGDARTVFFSPGQSGLAGRAP